MELHVSITHKHSIISIFFWSISNRSFFSIGLFVPSNYPKKRLNLESRIGRAPTIWTISIIWIAIAAICILCVPNTSILRFFSQTLLRKSYYSTKLKFLINIQAKHTQRSREKTSSNWPRQFDETLFLILFRWRIPLSKYRFSVSILVFRWKSWF